LIAPTFKDAQAVAPLLADLLSIPLDGRYSPLALTPARQKELTLRALVEQLVGLAARQPVLMLFECLLELFVQDLDRREVEVVLIGVDGHLAQFPRILTKVKELARRGLLTYVATEPWFRGVSSYASPEGHE
jgi:hypothetical protein